MALAITLHILGAVIWVGGMFFAYMALRPVAAALLEPPQRFVRRQPPVRVVVKDVGVAADALA